MNAKEPPSEPKSLPLQPTQETADERAAWEKWIALSVEAKAKQLVAEFSHTPTSEWESKIVVAFSEPRTERLAAQLNGVMNCLAISQREVERLRTGQPVGTTATNVGYCSVCRSTHVLTANNCRAMDGIA